APCRQQRGGRAGDHLRRRLPSDRDPARAAGAARRLGSGPAGRRTPGGGDRDRARGARAPHPWTHRAGRGGAAPRSHVGCRHRHRRPARRPGSRRAPRTPHRPPAHRARHHRQRPRGRAVAPAPDVPGPRRARRRPRRGGAGRRRALPPGGHRGGPRGPV
ncbi:MAG: Transcriptional regulator, MarR family, partial [uncultured Nocardioidaceae bacterium]